MGSSSKIPLSGDTAPASHGRQENDGMLLSVAHYRRVWKVSWGRSSLSRHTTDDSAFARQTGRRDIPGRKTDKRGPGAFCTNGAEEMGVGMGEWARRAGLLTKGLLNHAPESGGWN